MPLAYKGMSRKPFAFEDAASFNSVTDIRECAVTFDIGSIAPEDADVVEHGGFLYESEVDVKLPAPRAFQGFVCHKARVNQQDLEQRTGLIIMGYYFFWNHRK